MFQQFLPSYHELLKNTHGNQIIGCSNCGERHNARKWRDNKAHCPNKKCNHYGWSVC